jgi:hypothetical protein
MPIMGGSAMLAYPELTGIRHFSIILSSLPELTIRGRTSGAAAILRTPYTVDQVLGEIAEALRERRPLVPKTAIRLRLPTRLPLLVQILCHLQVVL